MRKTDKNGVGEMTTIAAEILRDFEARRAELRDEPAGKAPGPNPARLLMRKLCEDAQGIRISFHEWVFPDGSALMTRTGG
jgi:hypothetical protein